MHGHLSSLLSKVSSLLPYIGHFSRQFVRFLDVGLLSTQTWLGVHSRGRRVRGDRKTSNGLASPATKPDLLPEVGRLVQPLQPERTNGSLIASKTEDKPKRTNLIISVHLPKTGGTAFVKALRKCAEEVFYLDYGLEQLAPTALFRRGKLTTASFESIIGDLELFPGRSVIHGHFAAKKYSDLFPNAVYVTWLRDPVERVASHYFYWQRSHIPGDHRWEQFTAQKMSLEEFAALDFVRNVYSRWFSPLDVERFDFIGITEEYGRSLELFRRLICPEIKFHAKAKNFNPNRRGNFYWLDRELRSKILELNDRDAYIYIDGVRRFRCLCEEVGI
jgi:hypothetical protein